MSGDVMMFPDTVEEFMESYKIVDREQVYTNGDELVPIFRMRQWFDHVKHSPDDLRPVGKWINKTMSVPGGHGQAYNRWGCSKCKAKFKTRTKYCPNCGAKMEVSEDA